jgi:chromate transporter
VVIIGVQASRPKLADLAMVFARFGNFTFGGGDATAAVLRNEIVATRGWLITIQVDLSFALSRLTPGTNLLAFCAGVGWLLYGWIGALVALVAGSAPSSLLVVVVTALYENWNRNPFMQVALRGALAAAVGVMLVTGVTLIRPYSRETSWFQLALFTGGSFVLAYFLDVPPFRVLLVAAVAGMLWPQRRKV